MRRLLYASTSTGTNTEAVLDAIMQQSLHNNVMCGVTGLLWADPHRFMQIIEGPVASIRETYQRIQADDRHRDLTILHDGAATAREFGEWAMAFRWPTDRGYDYEARIDRILSKATASTRSYFLDFIGPDTI